MSSPAPDQPTVSAVIPTIGRSSVARAVATALAQTHRVVEVVVVLDAPVPDLDLPDDDRVRVISTSGGLGSSRARQAGIEAATGDLVALLDDDDEWYPDKLAAQLASVESISHDRWVASSRFDVVDHEGAVVSVWPERLIGERQPVDEYLCRFESIRFGGASLQTSTLVFPRSLAMENPMHLPRGAVHDDPSWLITVQQRTTGLVIRQIDQTAGRYNLTDQSLSRSGQDESREYIDWGKRYLAASDRRTRGDYFFTSPLASAVSGDSLAGVARSIVAGIRLGPPGVWATAFAILNTTRLLVRRVVRRIRSWRS